MSIRRKPKHLSLAEFEHVINKSALDLHIPTVRQLPPDVVYEMWQKMPNGTLSKEKIFTGAVALCIDYLAKESKK